jgi:PAS domain S-box-containing protein
MDHGPDPAAPGVRLGGEGYERGAARAGAPRPPLVWRYLAELVLFAAAYFLLGKLGLRLATVQPNASPVWAPSGLALALVLLRGYRVWPAVAVGAFLVNATTAGSLATAAAIALGNVLECLTGGYLVRRVSEGSGPLGTPMGVVKFALIAALPGPLISATIGIGALALAGDVSGSAGGTAWLTWWLGDVGGGLVAAPLLIAWATDFPRALEREALLGSAAVYAVAAAIGVLVFSPLPPLAWDVSPIRFIAILPLIWAAVARGQRETATVAFILACFAVWGIVEGGGVFTRGSLNDSFLFLLTFLSTAAVPSLALSADTTARERTAQTLRESEAKFRRVFEQSPLGKAVLAPDTRLREANPALCAMLERPAPALAGQVLADLVHPEDRPVLRRYLESLAAGAIDQFRVEARLLRDGSPPLWTSLAIGPIRNASGRILYSLGIFEDVEARKQAEERLRRLNEKLEERVGAEVKARELAEQALRQAQKMEAVGQLSGGIAHDFNNILAIIVWNIEVLQRRLQPEDPKLRRPLEMAGKAAARGAALVQRLLAFSRRQPLAPKAIDVNRLVLGMSDLLRSTLGEAVSIETVLGAGMWPISADPNQLEAALLNLAVNSRDAMPNGGKLTIETANTFLDESYAAREGAAPGQYGMIAVSDTGSGMSKEVAEHAFEPFFSTKQTGAGSGLGLSQVYGFAKQSGGHVKIYSEPEAGTTVKLYLPRATAGEVQSTAERSAAASPLAPRERRLATILVVEDDSDLRASTVETLRDIGHRILEASDGPTALARLAEAEGLELLFTDVVLPGGMTGRQIAEEAQRRFPGLKVLFTTGYARNAIVHQGRLDAGVELLAKPFTLDALEARIRRILEAG